MMLQKSFCFITLFWPWFYKTSQLSLYICVCNASYSNNLHTHFEGYATAPDTEVYVFIYGCVYSILQCLVNTTASVCGGTVGPLIQWTTHITLSAVLCILGKNMFLCLGCLTLSLQTH